jgi:hypothetical protein
MYYGLNTTEHRRTDPHPTIINDIYFHLVSSPPMSYNTGLYGRRKKTINILICYVIHP